MTPDGCSAWCLCDRFPGRQSKARRDAMARSRFSFFSPASLILTVAVAAICAPPPDASAQPSVTARPGEWRYLGNDPQATRYSPLDQITRDNFKDLKLAWRWKPAIGPAAPSTGGTAQGNGDPTFAMFRNESTPLMVNGVLYWTAGGQRVVLAADAATGRQLWTWNGIDEQGRDTKAPRRNAGRGVGYWTDGREERIFVITTGFFLVALDAKTGMVVPTFGNNGVVDLMKELNVEGDHVSRIGS